ncbi:cryptochrome DASH, chloroplastic/mitochondrial isoform X2 [Aristolochia californica]|uniref:cryptochrome DASH, chloroplastic/mitochondrial isoform X2 n=1 Tax=Aristolochia californica TaxID=171875 RepID=UPI0035D5B186
MAFVLGPRVQFFPSFRVYPRRRVVRSSKAVAMAEGREGAKKENGVALVWFKHDLRTDDHLGLLAACQYPTVLPLYVFDHRILSRFSDEMLELALLALEDLRKSLKDQGSDLLISFGSAENVIAKIVKEVKATHIFVEEEAEYNLRVMVDAVEQSLLSEAVLGGRPQLVCWRTPFYDIKDLEQLPVSYSDFLKLNIPFTTPLTSPNIPRMNLGLDRGVLPTFDDLKKYLTESSCKLDESWNSNKARSAQTVLMKKDIDWVDVASDSVERFSQSNSSKSRLLSSTSKNKKKRLEGSVFVSTDGNIVGGGTDVVLNALAAYLRYLEGTARDDWQEVHEKTRNTDSRKGASFGALFGAALQLGTVSRRRVYYEAIKYEKERNAGFLSPFGYSVHTVAAAVEGVSSMEWYSLVSLRSQTLRGGKWSVRVWRWKGHLIQYTALGHEGPAVLLVHGFGAFLEHFRDNLSSLANGGNRVWAITLLGFGKSEKPNVMYTEYMWAELLRDFIVDVVDEPVHLVGNSIGGYFASIVSGCWPTLVKTLVLINTAGSIIPGYSPVQFTEVGRTTGAVSLATRLLLLFLRLGARSILKSYYPTFSS